MSLPCAYRYFYFVAFQCKQSVSVELFIPVAEKFRDANIQLILTSFSKVSSVFRAVHSRVSSALSPAKLARTVQQLEFENEKRFAEANSRRPEQF